MYYHTYCYLCVYVMYIISSCLERVRAEASGLRQELEAARAQSRVLQGSERAAKVGYSYGDRILVYIVLYVFIYIV